MTVFDNPYIKQLGLLPFQEQPQQSPLEGLLSPRGLVSFGANMLANPNENFFQQLGQGIGGAVNAVDAYNQQLNKNAMANAEYNLNVGELATRYDIGMAQAAALASKQAQADNMQNLLLAKFGIAPPQAPVTADNPNIAETPENLGATPPEGFVPPVLGEGQVQPNATTGILPSLAPTIDGAEYMPMPNKPTGQVPQPAGILPVPTTNANLQQGQEMLRVGGVLGQAPLVSAGKEITDIGKAQLDKDIAKSNIGNTLQDLQASFNQLSDEDLSPIQASSAGRMIGQQLNTDSQKRRDAYQGRIATLAAQLTPLIRPAGSGAWTDSDQERLERMLPDLSKSKEANAQLIEDLNKKYGGNITLPKPDTKQPTAKQPKSTKDFSGFKIRKK